MEKRGDLEHKFKVIFELHMYNEELSREEALSLVSMYFSKHKVMWEGNIGKRKAIEIEVVGLEQNINKIARRLGLIRRFGRVIDSLPSPLLANETWYVEFKGFEYGERKEMLKFLEEKGVKLDIKGSKRLVVFNTQNSYDGYKMFEIVREVKEKDFLEREPQNRPGFVPYTLRPRVARALVNISRIKEEGMLGDPFCGVGGVLIEAQLMGLRCLGVDIRKDNIKKAIENLEHYSSGEMKSYFVVGNSLSPYFFKNKKVLDGIVSDLPYGRMSPKKGKEEGMAQAIVEYSKRCKEKSRIVVMTKQKDFDELVMREDEEGSLGLIHKFDLRVRKSLTRYVFVFCNNCN